MSDKCKCIPPSESGLWFICDKHRGQAPPSKGDEIANLHFKRVKEIQHLQQAHDKLEAENERLRGQLKDANGLLLLIKHRTAMDLRNRVQKYQDQWLNETTSEGNNG